MKVTIGNRLPLLLHQRGIRSASEFARRMTAAGFPMSSSHATRFQKQDGPAFNMDFLRVACNVLQCLPNEFYDITVELEPTERLDPIIIPPHHAVLVRQDGSSPYSPPVAPAVAEPSRDASGKASHAHPRQDPEGASQKTSSPSDTGPTGVVFPFVGR